MPLNVRHSIILHIAKKEKKKKNTAIYNMPFLIRHIQVLEMLKCEEKRMKLTVNELWHFLHFFFFYSRKLRLEKSDYKDDTHRKLWSHRPGSQGHNLPTLPRFHYKVLSRWSVLNIVQYISVGHCRFCIVQRPLDTCKAWNQSSFHWRTFYQLYDWKKKIHKTSWTIFKWYHICTTDENSISFFN